MYFFCPGESPLAGWLPGGPPLAGCASTWPAGLAAVVPTVKAIYRQRTASSTTVASFRTPAYPPTSPVVVHSHVYGSGVSYIELLVDRRKAFLLQPLHRPLPPPGVT